MAKRCQVDFYLLGSPELQPERLACKLALMAWERGHRVSVVSASEAQAGALDRLMWAVPEGRFLPHERGTEHPAPVQLLTAPPDEDGDVVINLTDAPMPGDLPWRRLLEIVPHRTAEREASREKFRAYRAQGLQPKTHDIN